MFIEVAEGHWGVDRLKTVRERRIVVLHEAVGGEVSLGEQSAGRRKKETQIGRDLQRGVKQVASVGFP